ncbi:hypothetical protein, partial [Vibrio harveyi]|uniref:hypothetical protein n=1 Tax=Vibrio harveyi TaxID=669 RepID=UPI000A7DA0CD
AYIISELLIKRFNNNSLKWLYESISYLGLITSVISLTMFLNSDIKELVLSNIDMKMASSMVVKTNLRITDTSLGGGTNLSLFFLIASVCNIVIIKKSEKITLLHVIM